MLSAIVIDKDICRDYARSSRLEWLETNGTGGFAMGSVSGANTRRYHALLVASLRPPVERHVLLSRFDETLNVNGASYGLSACQYPGCVNPTGYQYLEQFSLDPLPTWTFKAGDVTIRKQVFLAWGRQTVIIRYVADRDATLQLRPFLAFRDYHSMSHANPQFNGWLDVSAGALTIKPYEGLPALDMRHNGSQLHQDGVWYRDVEYLAELDRGLDFREDVYFSGTIDFQLKAGQAAWIIAGTGSVAGLNVDDLLAERLARVCETRLDAAADASSPLEPMDTSPSSQAIRGSPIGAATP